MDGSVAPRHRLATYADICALPDHVTGEILDGVLIATPRPTPRHIRAETVLTMLLGPPFDRGVGGPGGWHLAMEPEIHLSRAGGTDIVVPDIAGWILDRLPAIPTASHYTTAPDWVCEVLSERSVRRDRVTKLNTYRRHGVPFYWIVDPDRRTLDVLRLEADRWILDATFAEDDDVAAVPFPSFIFNLAQLWTGTAG